MQEIQSNFSGVNGFGEISPKSLNFGQPDGGLVTAGDGTCQLRGKLVLIPLETYSCTRLGVQNELDQCLEDFRAKHLRDFVYQTAASKTRAKRQKMVICLGLCVMIYSHRFCPPPPLN